MEYLIGLVGGRAGGMGGRINIHELPAQAKPLPAGSLRQALRKHSRCFYSYSNECVFQPRRSSGRMALRILSGVGSVLRQAGRAVDSFGASLQGNYAYREACAPSLLLCVTCVSDDTQYYRSA